MERLIGKQAPYFSMEALSADGEHFVRVALPDYAGKWLVLFFYPMDFTFVCPTELTAFSEHRETFRAAGAELLSVSTDSVYTHQAWQRNGLGGLGYPMAADQTLRVCADYGVLLEEEGVALRGLFLIDPEQKVRYSVIHDNNIGRNPEACAQPAGRPGRKTSARTWRNARLRCWRVRRPCASIRCPVAATAAA